jgi:hypothetical protein
VDFLADGRAVRAVAETKDAHKDQLFEIAERLWCAFSPHCG